MNTRSDRGFGNDGEMVIQSGSGKGRAGFFLLDSFYDAIKLVFELLVHFFKLQTSQGKTVMYDLCHNHNRAGTLAGIQQQNAGFARQKPTTVFVFKPDHCSGPGDVLKPDWILGTILLEQTIGNETIHISLTCTTTTNWLPGKLEVLDKNSIYCATYSKLLAATT